MMKETALYWVILYIVRLIDIPFMATVMCLYANKFNRRNRFRVRMAGYICILVAVLVATNLVYEFLLQSYITSQIFEVIFILAQFLGMFLLYRESWKKILTAYILVYLSTFMTYNILELIFSCCGVNWTEDISYMLYYLGGEAALDIAYAFPLYFIYIKRIRGLLSSDTDGWIIVLLVYSIIITLVMSAVREGYVGAYNYNIQPINIFIIALGILNSLFVMYAVYIYLKGRASAREKEVINTMWKQDRARYEVRKENIAALNIKSHDLKNYINMARFRGPVAEELADEMEEVVQRYDSDIRTGNDALDVILSEHSAYCSSHGITLKCIADGEALSGISGADIYTMFDNILLNSEEYLSTVEDPDKRVCLIEVKKVRGMVHIHQENYFSGSLVRQEGEIQTTKEDPVNHGYGLKSIRAIAEKYGGEMSVTASGGLFNLDVIMMPS
ncbi:MAG: GHKL domain-containing protein [Clostridia bacterium]|nr:GHKL domain-containing protein [Clostridia bacterium]